MKLTDLTELKKAYLRVGKSFVKMQAVDVLVCFR